MHHITGGDSLDPIMLVFIRYRFSADPPPGGGTRRTRTLADADAGTAGLAEAGVD